MSKRIMIDPTTGGWPLAAELYHRLLDLFYSQESKARAVPVAFRLLRMLDKLDPNSDTLLTLAARAVIAELDGDLTEAIHYRQRELAVMDQLIAKRQLEAADLTYADYADRLDLIANLALELGDLEAAEMAIERSVAFCRKHRVKFDGADIRTAIRKARKLAPTAA